MAIFKENMRKFKVVKIDDREITIHELRVKDIMSVADGKTTDLLALIKELLPKATSLTLKEIQNMSPSELKLIYDAFKEVNEVFFGLAASLKLTSLLETLKQGALTAVQKDLSKLFADSSNGGIQEPQTTDIPSLESH